MIELDPKLYTLQEGTEQTKIILKNMRYHEKMSMLQSETKNTQ